MIFKIMYIKFITYLFNKLRKRDIQPVSYHEKRIKNYMSMLPVGEAIFGSVDDIYNYLESVEVRIYSGHVPRFKEVIKENVITDRLAFWGMMLIRSKLKGDDLKTSLENIFKLITADNDLYVKYVLADLIYKIERHDADELLKIAEKQNLI